MKARIERQLLLNPLLILSGETDDTSNLGDGGKQILVSGQCLTQCCDGCQWKQRTVALILQNCDRIDGASQGGTGTFGVQRIGGDPTGE